MERDELDPDRDGGRSLEGLLPPALSPLSPILSRSRSLDSIDKWSPFGRGDGDS